MPIYVDAMGGDHAPSEIASGALLALSMVSEPIALIGKAEAISQELKKLGAEGLFEVVSCSESIEMDEDPAAAVRRKKDSSIVIGCQLARENEGSAFVSAGSTGALLAAGLMYIKRIPGVQRAALATVLPIKKPVMLLDIGANADCKPEYLVQFAKMGIIYMQSLFGIASPSVGLMSIGTEDTKGSAFTKQCFAELKQLGPSFAGNIEPTSLFEPTSCDIAVSDGFTGNIVLKTIEGAMAHSMSALYPAIAATGNSGAEAIFEQARSSLDPTSVGGAPFLGIEGCLIKAHGSSRAQAISNAIRQASSFLGNNALEKIKAEII
ncbi:MAG: phosphate acyltransferase PlsX [Eubacteriaceae bacterium]|nr:phosphate acyltransferase PlsX [Eubacteriaceae bacterium]